MGNSLMDYLYREHSADDLRGYGETLTRIPGYQSAVKDMRMYLEEVPEWDAGETTEMTVNDLLADVPAEVAATALHDSYENGHYNRQQEFFVELDDLQHVHSKLERQLTEQKRKRPGRLDRLNDVLAENPYERGKQSMREEDYGSREEVEVISAWKNDTSFLEDIRYDMKAPLGSMGAGGSGVIAGGLAGIPELTLLGGATMAGSWMSLFLGTSFHADQEYKTGREVEKNRILAEYGVTDLTDVGDYDLYVKEW